jgi:hypothetical protein
MGCWEESRVNPGTDRAMPLLDLAHRTPEKRRTADEADPKEMISHLLTEKTLASKLYL